MIHIKITPTLVVVALVAALIWLSRDHTPGQPLPVTRPAPKSEPIPEYEDHRRHEDSRRIWERDHPRRKSEAEPWVIDQQQTTEDLDRELVEAARPSFERTRATLEQMRRERAGRESYSERAAKRTAAES